MSKFKEGDIVVREHEYPSIGQPLYFQVGKIVHLDEIGDYIFAQRYDCDSSTTNGLYEFWEDEVKLVDMKGAYI